MAEPTTELLPLYEQHRQFTVGMRGYDRAQVDRELGKLDEDLRYTAQERDSASARSADLAAQLASAQAQVESLRRQLRAATENVTADNVDSHVRQILQAARAEGTRLREEAQTESDRVRNGAADAAARTRAAAQAEADRVRGEADARKVDADETFRSKVAEVEARRTEVESGLAASEQRTRDTEAQLSAEAAAERERLDSESTARREQLDSDSETARRRADEDFEITLRGRRTAAADEQAARKSAAETQARDTIAAAKAQAEQLVADATHEVRRLHGVRDTVHADLDALNGRLRTALDVARAATPAEPALPKSAPKPR